MSVGGCLCGAVRYRIVGAPTSSILCHCESCRRASGAPAVAWVTIERGQFEFLSGSPVAYQSSPGITRRFCGRCGSALTYETAQSPASIDVTTASLDDPGEYPPSAEVWLEDKVPWLPTDARLPHYPRSSSAN